MPFMFSVKLVPSSINDKYKKEKINENSEYIENNHYTKTMSDDNISDDKSDEQYKK